MKERPILFSGPMVRAIIEGQKTQTRRVVTPQWDQQADVKEMSATTPEGWQTSGHSGRWWCAGEANSDEVVRCPYGIPGDRLWVRETFWGKHDVEYGDYGVLYSNAPCLDVGKEFHPGIDYCATPEAFNPPRGEEARGRPIVKHEKEEPGTWWLAPPDKWDGTDEDHSKNGSWVFLPWPEAEYTKHPSIHMPRWASRIDLEVTGIRVERIQDITEEDAKAEGVQIPVTTEQCPPGMCRPLVNALTPYRPGPRGITQHNLYRAEFAFLWDSINGKRGFSWEKNPWVWVVSFKLLRPVPKVVK